MYCNNHKEKNMINLRSQKCVINNQNMDFKEKKNLYCVNHKKKFMINLYSKELRKKL